MILDNTTIKGIWWRAEEPTTKLQGQVTYGPSCGAEVDVFGQFYKSFDDKTLTERFTLHGCTFKNTPISLFGSIIIGGEIHLPGGRSCKIKSCSGVAGGHFSSMEEVSFKEVYVHFKGLTDWMCVTGMQLSATEEPQGFVANYKVPSGVSLGKFGAFSIRLEFSGHLQPGFHRLQFQEECVLVITARQMEPFAAFEQHVLTFQRFLSLAIQRPTPALQIIGHIDKPREVIQDKPIFENFLIIRELAIPNWSRDSLIPQDLLFGLPELGNSPETVYGKFVDRQAALLSALDLYFSTVYHEGQSPRVDFLILAQGLEAYHRATMPPGKYMRDELYETGLRKALMDAIPQDDRNIDPDFRSSLKNKLKYLHEFSLNKRLRDIARRHEVVLEQLIGKPQDFAKAVSDLRNELTHPGELSARPEPDCHQLLRLSEQMALVLEACFFDELGFGQEQIRAIVFNRSQRANRILRGWI